MANVQVVVKKVTTEELQGIDPTLAMYARMVEESPEMLRSMVMPRIIDRTIKHFDDRYDELPKKDVGGGFAFIGTVCIPNEDDGVYSMLLNEKVAKEMFGTIDDMFDAAVKNAKPAKMYGVVASIGGYENAVDFLENEEAKVDEMMVLTSDPINGAYAIGLPGVQKRIAERIGGSYWVIPSSTHEVMIVPDDGSISASMLNSMVRDANETLVTDPREKLADNVRYYDAETDELSIRM